MSKGGVLSRSHPSIRPSGPTRDAHKGFPPECIFYRSTGSVDNLTELCYYWTMSERGQSLPYSMHQAAEKFGVAQRQAFFQHLLALLTGRSDELLSFDEVRRLLRARQQRDQGTHMIPLERIVGSEGRYQDFTRTFLPLQGADKNRWMRLDRAVNVLEDLPPIEVYQIGEVYFVRDGHHRVSVARANGFAEIEAEVTRLETPVSLEPDVQLEELVLKAGAVEFLEATGLQRVRPQADVRLTEPGLYVALREHIDVHRYYLGLEQQREIPYEEAAASWYDHVYSPALAAIRESGVMREFPHRTEADLYLWIIRHREELREDCGPQVDTGEAAADFAAQHSERPLSQVVRRAKQAAQAVWSGATESLDHCLPEPEPETESLPSPTGGTPPAEE